MMKSYTDEDIARFIINSSSTMFEDGFYYIHVDDDGDLSETAQYCATFEVAFDASEYENDLDPCRFYDEVERLDNAEFMCVCFQLALEVNHYLEEIETALYL